jgi:OmcA/MtrC family decaheme c-type cytochrome
MRSKQRRARWTSAGLALVSVAAITFACEGPPGPPGPAGASAPTQDASSDAAPPPPDGGDGGAPDVASPPRSHVATGPGLKLAITKSAIATDGSVTMDFTVTDGAGVPLDYAGTYTDGAVNAKWVISWLGQAGLGDGGAPLGDAGPPLEYTAYTTQPHASADGSNTSQLPDSDTGGKLTEVGVGQGTYEYVFGTKLPAGFDGTKTHTVGVWATRVVLGLTYVVNVLSDFVPNGGPVTSARDIVTTEACNQCHNPLGYHEGDTARRDVHLCTLCHSSQASDPSNGNSLALPIMAHKIHRGRFLPSVLDGGVYQLTEDEPVGDAGPDVDASAIATTLIDHSGAWFPGEVQNCGMCHQGSQGNVWTSVATRAVCGSCHDLTSFVFPIPPGSPPGTKLHSGGKQSDDTKCLNAGCHGAADHYSVANVHATPSTDPSAPTLTLTIASVTGTQPGQTPVLHFAVTQNGVPLDLLAAPLPWLAATLAGPTTDYAQAEPQIVTIENGHAPPDLVQDGAVGSYAFTFPSAMPPPATGSYAVGMEGYLQPSGPGGPVYAALNPVAYVAVTDPTPTPRRTVVERGKCNSCHYDLLAHGGTRKSPEYCVLCHTPNQVDAEDAPRFEVPTTTVRSLNFKVLVHKVHRGSTLAQGYVVGGDPGPTPAAPGGTPIDFGKVRFPGDLKACWACHASTSYLPPLPSALLPTVAEEVLACTDATLNPNAYCANRVTQSQSLLSPISAACTACHDAPSSVAHAQANTAPGGDEACVVCHGPGQPWDAQGVHTLPP